VQTRVFFHFQPAVITNLFSLAGQMFFPIVQNAAVWGHMAIKRLPGDPQSLIESLLANGTTQKFIAQRYHTTVANLHNWIKKHSLKTIKSHTVE